MSILNEYKNPYFLLFNSITDTIERLESIMKEFDTHDTILKALQKEINTLKSAQINAEELFISTWNLITDINYFYVINKAAVRARTGHDAHFLNLQPNSREENGEKILYDYA